MPKQSPKDSTAHLPEFILLALARNPSADPAYRKAAVEHLLEKGYDTQASHPDIYAIVETVKRERSAKQEVQAIVEAATEEPLEEKEEPASALKAGFTTQNQMQDEVVDINKTMTPKSFWRK